MPDERPAPRAGLDHGIVRRGELNCTLHCHSAGEELFVVLDGEGSACSATRSIRSGADT
jgi:uncharacterized cupin superfamily protein